LKCKTGTHIVINKASIFLDGKKHDESARYPIMMACYMEMECQFHFTENVYKYLNVKLEGKSELVVNYVCRVNSEIKGIRRIDKFATTNNCPHDSFVQKHVAYFSNKSIAPKRHVSEAVRREWELIAMEVCARMRLFRTTTDPFRHAVFLIYENQALRNDFEEITDEKYLCKLKNNARLRTIMYNCNRNNYKWTCNFQSLEQNVAVHEKNTGHFL
ncbi:hypothetical protein KR074_006387, partial [Drosophila pseudoananassae]